MQSIWMFIDSSGYISNYIHNYIIQGYVQEFLKGEGHNTIVE